MPHGDDNTWIQTFTAKRFYPLDPREEDIDIIDIAHALAMKCRYTGHCKDFFSVAQHSVHVAEIVAWTHPQLAITALLHDAAEAYIADVARPVKRSITQLAEIEQRLEVVIAKRFNLAFPFPDVIKTADNILLATERRDLMPNPPRPWKTYGVDPISFTIDPWPWQRAKADFLAMFDRLTKPVQSVTVAIQKPAIEKQLPADTAEAVSGDGDSRNSNSIVNGHAGPPVVVSEPPAVVSGPDKEPLRRKIVLYLAACGFKRWDHIARDLLVTGDVVKELLAHPWFEKSNNVGGYKLSSDGHVEANRLANK